MATGYKKVEIHFGALALLIFLILTFSGCHPGNSQERYKNLIVNPVDSITLIVNNPTIDTSNFVFHEKQYAIYFQRNEVIEFCDSILNGLPLYIKGEIDTLWGIRFGFEYLKFHATNNKIIDAERSDYLPTLLERFRPYVIDTITKDIPPFILLTKELSINYQGTTYKLVSPSFDTTIIAYGNDYRMIIHDVELENIRLE